MELQEDRRTPTVFKMILEQSRSGVRSWLLSQNAMKWVARHALIMEELIVTELATHE